MRRPRLHFDIGAEDNSGRAFSSLQRSIDETERRLGAAQRQFAAVAGAAMAFGAAITTAALSGARQIDETAKAARRLDASIGGFRALELAANEAGVSLSSLTNDIQTMNREIAANSTGAQRALQRLGVSARELTELDVDEHVALIADRVNELGMSAGEATALLRDLGIRNREMVLLMMQGGSAIRAARNDIRDYGLEIDDALGAKIEEANDRIARLGIVTQYFGQRLAAEIVPALGRFSHAITESMREGGNLRMVIDGLVDNMDRLAIYVGTVVTAFGVRYVAALAAARLATLSLAGSLAFLRGALIRTGIGALVVGAGELVYQFTRLVQGAGGFGEALRLLEELGTAVMAEIGQAGRALQLLLSGVAWGIAAAFIRAFKWIFDQWDRLINAMYSPFNTLMEAIGSEMRIHAVNPISSGLESIAQAAERAGVSAARGAQQVYEGMSRTRAAVAALQAALSDLSVESDETEDALSRLNAALDEMGDSSGGGAGGAAQAIRGDLTPAIQAMGQEARRVEGMFASTFSSIIRGSQSAGEAISRLLDQLADMLAQQAFRALFGGLFGGFGGSMFGGPGGGGTVTPFMSLIPGNAKGTDNWRGGLTRINEEGGEILNLPRGTQIIPHDISKEMARSGGGMKISVNIDARGAVEGVADQVAKVIKEQLPAALKQSSAYSADRRLRGFPA